MEPALIDTDILSLFFRNNQNAVSNFKIYLKEHEKINLTIVTYYEIISGLKHRDALKQLDLFLKFASQNSILPLTEKYQQTCMLACERQDKCLMTLTSLLLVLQ